MRCSISAVTQPLALATQLAILAWVSQVARKLLHLCVGSRLIEQVADRSPPKWIRRCSALG
jgi:pyrroloquinoline quinone (PQQ) biosynthesis protein C